MGCVRARVELWDLPNSASSQDRKAAFNRMLAVFKKQVADAGILQQFRQHEFYESKGEKKRRKKKESNNLRMKAKLRENFPDRRNFKKDKDEQQ